MKRRIIEIDQDKCNGCGACAAACHEGAIAMVDGKARLMRDDYCDRAGERSKNSAPAERKIHSVAGGHRNSGRPAGGRITKSLEKGRKKHNEVYMQSLRLII
mgnify:CR=1 FL=1